MIALLLAGALHAAPDSTELPFHVSAYAGPEVLRVGQANLWFESSVQAEFRTFAMLRYGYSFPLFDQSGNNRKDASDLQRYSHTLSVAKEWRGANSWTAIGGGWSWMRLDTTALYDDPRTIYVDNGGGLQLLTTSYPGMWGGVEMPDHIGWKWAKTVEKRSPYLFVEVGTGWDLLSCGFRVEYRYGFGVGFFLRTRLPTTSGG